MRAEEVGPVGVESTRAIELGGVELAEVGVISEEAELPGVESEEVELAEAGATAEVDPEELRPEGVEPQGVEVESMLSVGISSRQRNCFDYEM